MLTYISVISFLAFWGLVLIVYLYCQDENVRCPNGGAHDWVGSNYYQTCTKCKKIWQCPYWD